MMSEWLYVFLSSEIYFKLCTLEIEYCCLPHYVCIQDNIELRNVFDIFYNKEQKHKEIKRRIMVLFSLCERQTTVLAK